MSPTHRLKLEAKPAVFARELIAHAVRRFSRRTAIALVLVVTVGVGIVGASVSGSKLRAYLPPSVAKIFTNPPAIDARVKQPINASVIEPLAPTAVALSWNTFGNLGTETTEPSTTNDPNLSAANLTLGAGVTPAANGNRFGGSNWFDTGDTNPTTLAESIAGNDYIQFVVTPNSGFSFTPTSLVFSWDRSATGPSNLTLRSSADGFAANLGTVTGLAASQTTGNTITISGLTNLTTAITFRLYGYGATGTSGTGGFDTASSVNNVVLNGTTAALPTLGTYAPTSVGLSGNVLTANPSAPPANATSLTASTTSNFYGTLTVDNTTGAVRVTNAYPAGTYPVTVKAFGPGGTATQTFTLTVSTPAVCSNTVAFVAAADVSGPEAIQNVTTGDFNNDGKQDLVFARLTNNSIAIRLGDGAGNFSGTGGTGVGSTPYAITVGDFNGDGKLDAATANEIGQSISFALGDGAGGLASATTITAGFASNGPKDIRAADMNGDGNLDLVFVTGAVPSGGISQIGVAIGDGAGGFAAPTYTSTTVSGGYAYGMAVGDLNNDGKVDVAVAHYIAASYSVSLGNGTGGFTSTANYSSGGTGAAFVSLGDLNNANGPDLVGTVISGNTLPFANNGAGTLSALPTLATPGAQSVVIGDFNRDGKPDLAVAENSTVKQTSIWLGSGTGTFTPLTVTSGGFSPVGSSIADVNGDGYQDILTANGNGSSGLVTVRLGACVVLVKYRSRQSGNWNDFNTWDVNTGSGFVPAVSGQTPTSADDTIQIQSPHTVTVAAAVAADQLTVDSGGTLVVNNGITLTIDNGIGTDCLAAGTVSVIGTGLISGAGDFNLTSGATLVIGSANGITTAPTASGSIQTAVRSFNSGANYTYNGLAAQVTGNGLPLTVSGTVAINNGAGVTLSQASSFNNSLQLTSGTFDLNTLTLTLGSAGGGIVANGGARTINNGLLSVTGSKAVTQNGGGSVVFGNGLTVQLSSGLNFGLNLSTVNGTLRINAGGFSNTNGPTYGSSSLLQYNSGGIYGRASEWLPGVTSGVGYPANVQLSNSTTLNLANGSTASSFKLAGNLTINSSCTMDMTAGGAVGQPLTVVGSVLNSGTLALSTNAAGNLNVGGNLTTTAYISNNRTLTFNGSVAQAWTDTTGGQNFGSVLIANTSGGVSLTTAISAQTLTLTSGILTTTSANLFRVTNTTAGAISGGSASSYVNGPLARILPASLVTGSTYSFPVGKSGLNPFELVNPTTNAGGTITVQAEEFDGNSGGTPGTGLTALNTNRYWQASITSGAANFTNTQVRLSDTPLVSLNRIGKSATVNGSYDSIGGSVSGSTITSNSFSSFSFFNIGNGMAGSVQFSAANYNDSETNADHTATITATRTGGSDGAVGVSYATSNGSATLADNDYTTSSGTLSWADGDAADKTFTVTVKGDTTYEADETVNLTLSTPTGGVTIGSPNPATLTITNDDAAPGTLVVTKTADTNGTCVVGNCSLREAISAANSNPADANTINFNIPNTDPGLDGNGVYVITPGSQLPALTALITIDGTSQTTFGGNSNANGPEVAINGAGVVSLPVPFNFVDGLKLSGGNCTVKGLIINGFNTTGFANRGIFIDSSGNTIQGNYIGTNAAGTSAVANGDGILIQGATVISNFIGGVLAGQGNVISGNAFRGLVIRNDASGAEVYGNFIGTNASGTAAVANANAGVELSAGANQNAIGAVAAGARNIISGNGADGVKIDGGGSFNNNVTANYIGTDVTGAIALGNAGAGVRMSSGTVSNHVGGLSASTRNIISANGSGVLITGIGTSSNHVDGNYLGTDVTGTAAIGNLEAGIDISGGATNNQIGDGSTAARNVISGNSGALGTPAGVLIRDNGTNGNNVLGNYIGVASDGTTALGNTGGGAAGSQGVFIKSGAANNIIGGITPDEGNIIANNTGDGVRVFDDASGTGSTTTNAIRGNSIYNNSNLGINLFKSAEGDGVVTPNDALDTDNGPNGLQNFPVITTATPGSTTVSGTLNSAAAAAFEIDIYSNASCDASGNGEGRTYLGSVTTAATNGSGNVSFSVTVPVLTVGQVLTATATAADGSTSEFSACYSVTAACTPPGTVYVDDSWVGTPIGTDPDMGGPATNFGCDSFATIQGGVDGVAPSGFVNVAAGTYVENITITKALTLTGAGAGSVFVYPALSAPNTCGGSSLCPGGSNIMLVQASDVSIASLTLDGDNPSLTSAENFGGANIDARNGIITNHLLGTYNNLEVRDTTIKNIYLRGVYASSGGTFNFHDNTVQNVQASFASIGMFNFAGAGAYTDNNVSACNDAISSNHSRGTSYTGNTVTASASGIHSDNAGDSGGTPDTIANNTVTNSTVNGYGIWVFVPYKTVSVDNNTVTNVDVGLAVFGDSGVTTTNKPNRQLDGQSAPAVNTPSAIKAPGSVNVGEPNNFRLTDLTVSGHSFVQPNAPPVAPFSASFNGNTVNGQNKANSTGAYFTTSQIGFGSGNPKVAFTSNNVFNNVDGFYLEVETGFTLETASSFNRIVNNTNSQVTQASGAGLTGTLNGSMENNWWGCNAGPNSAGCGSVVGSGVDFDPWIILSGSASPSTINPGGSSTVTADMTHNSAAAVLTGTLPDIAVSYSATNGTMNPTSGTVLGGTDSSIFTSSNNMSAIATITVDNQPVNVPITITATPSYTWVGTVNSDWQIPLNWSPTRLLPGTSDILFFNGTMTPAPIVTNVPTQTIGALHLTNGVLVTLQASAARTLTIGSGTGSDLTVPAGTSLTLDGSNGITMVVSGAGSLGTIGGGVVMQTGFHRLFGDVNGVITFQSGATCATGAGLASNPFGTGTAGDGATGSVIFASGASYFHNAGQSPFGSVGNGPVAVFQTGSSANWLTSSGFQAGGRTYANLIIGNATTATNVSDTGAGNFQFDSLTVNSTSTTNSGLTFNGSGASTVTIRGDITSNGAGDGGTLPDVTISAGTGGISLDKVGAGTLILSSSSNTRAVDFESSATVASGTTLALSRKLLLGIIQPSSFVLTVDGGLTGGAGGYVIGNVKRSFTGAESFTYHLGTVNGYSPMDANVTAATGSLTAVAVQGSQPVLAAATSLQRYWTLIEAGTVTADLTFHYLDPADIAGNEANYRIVKVESGNATSFPNACPSGNFCVDTSANTATAKGVSTFSDWTVAEPNAPTAVRLAGFTATRTGDEVTIQWQSGYEARNLGYYVYREQSGKRTQLTPSLVAGSALTVGTQTVMAAGRSYTWYDQGERTGRGQHADALRNVTYWLEDVDVDGTRTLHGPIAPSFEVNAKQSRPAQSEMLGAGQRKAGTTGTTFSSWAADFAEQQQQLVTPPVLTGNKPPLTQSEIAASPGLKIAVTRTGWYRVTQAEMLAAGFNPKDNEPLLQLYANAVEVPIKISGNGTLTSPADYLEFYGHGLDSPTDAAQTYYLVVGHNNGKRIGLGPEGHPVQPSGPASFEFTIERKDRFIYYAALLNGDGENTFGHIVRPTPVSETLPVKHPDPAGGQARLEVSFVGVTQQAHNVTVSLNGQNLGTVTFSNNEHPSQSFNVPASLLLAGDNTLQFASLGGDTDISLVDTMRLTYAHLYVADSGSLTISTNSSKTKRVLGFTSGEIRAMDITNVNGIVEVRAQVDKDDAGNYYADIQVPAASSRTPHTLLVFAEQAVAHPDSIKANEPSAWRTHTVGSDYLIITTQGLKASVEPLAVLRRAQGLVVDVIDVEDLYDEFSYGLHTPQAIKSLVQTANATWTRKPHYLLLAGDASYDPKNYTGQGYNDLVPTRLIDTALLETASDDWLADLNGDGVADLAVGRLPVRNAATMNALVAKIISYENMTPDPTRAAMLVADNSFEANSNAVQLLLPSGLPVQLINRSSADDATTHSQIISSLNQGPKVANYFGHGSNGVWTSAGLLTANDAAGLTNQNRLSVFVMMTCFNGYFQDASFDSLSEALLKSPGGAVAVWASSGMTDPSSQSAVDLEVYRQLFGGASPALGDAVRAAKQTTSDADVRRTWILFGDPAMRLR